LISAAVVSQFPAPFQTGAEMDHKQIEWMSPLPLAVVATVGLCQPRGVEPCSFLSIDEI
jgi:hypothetical protein